MNDGLFLFCFCLLLFLVVVINYDGVYTCLQSQKQTYTCIHAHSYFHLIYISNTQKHTHAHILTHSYILTFVYFDTQKTLYRNSRIIILIIIDRVYIALFSAFEQTHCVHVACDCE